MKSIKDISGAGCAGIAGAIFSLPMLVAVLVLMRPGLPPRGHVPAAPDIERSELYALIFMFFYWPFGLLGVFLVLASVVLYVIQKFTRHKKGPPFAE